MPFPVRVYLNTVYDPVGFVVRDKGELDDVLSFFLRWGMDVSIENYDEDDEGDQ